MNWKQVEQRLRDASVEAIQALGRDQPAEPFYGFAFDCNADYGEVNLSLNTEADLAATAARHYPGYSQREIDGELRWSSGDWKYTGFNTDPPYAEPWEAAWAETQEAIQAAYLDDDDEGVPPRFLESVCRVLIAMEENGGLEPISRAEGFKTLVRDHDESHRGLVGAPAACPQPPTVNVTYESRCCPFIRFELAVQAEGGSVHLRLGGRPGVGEFLRESKEAA